MGVEEVFIPLKKMPPFFQELLKDGEVKGFKVKMEQLREVRKAILKLSSGRKATLAKDIGGMFANKGSAQLKQAVDTFFEENYPRRKVKLKTYSKQEVFEQARKAHALSVFDEFKKTVQLFLINKLAGDTCPPEPSTHVEKDADRLSELSKDLIKAVQFKINPECPICMDDIPSGEAAQCRHPYGPARHIFHLTCAQDLEGHARQSGSRRVACPVCRFEMLRNFQRIQIDGEEIVSHSPDPDHRISLAERIESIVVPGSQVCLMLLILLYVPVALYMFSTTELGQDLMEIARPFASPWIQLGATSLCSLILPSSIPSLIKWFACFLFISLLRG